MTSYPVAIIGGGVAGLTAGLTLAAAGIECILFEASDRVGGCCATIQENGLSFEPAASVVIGANMLTDVLSPLGLDLSPLLTPMQPIVRVLWPEDEFDLVGGAEALAESLRSWAPADALSMLTFVERCIKISRRLPTVLWDWKMGQGFNKASICALLPWTFSSYRSLIRRSFVSHRMRKVLEAFSVFYAGVPASEAPAILGMLPALAIGEGCYEVRGGIQRLPDHLAGKLKQAGMNIRLNEPVRKLILSDSSVCEIETVAGVTRVSAVVATCDIRTTLGFLPQRPQLVMTRLRVGVLRPSASCISLIGFEQRDSGLPPITWVLPKHEANGRVVSSHLKGCSLLPHVALTRGPGSVGERALRVGGAVISGTAARLASDSNQLTDELMRSIENVGLKLNLSKIQLWTPADYEARLGLVGGAAFGFAASKWQLGPARYGPRTPVRNLVVAGQSCFPGYGIPFTAFSGRLAATILGEQLNVRFPPFKNRSPRL